MKRFKRLFLTIFVLCICAFTFSACSNTTAGGNANRSTDLDIGDPQFDFVKEEEYDEDTYVFNPNKKVNNLNVDADYFLFLTFDVNARQNNNGQSVLNVNITFDVLDVLNATVQEANTGAMVEMQYIDATTGKPGKTITLSFKVPPESAKPRKIDMTIKLKPAAAGESHIQINYDYDAPDGYRITGSDGYTKNLTINKVQIQAPVVSLTSLGTLTWNHVKNADYYYIYESSNTNTPLTDVWGEVIIIEAHDAQVGAQLSYNIREDYTGFHIFVIKAFSDNPNITPSSISNPIENDW